MSIVINISEAELENSILSELEPVLKVLIGRVIHRELSKMSKRQIMNGVWEPLPGSLSNQMWSKFESENLNRISPDFTSLNFMAVSKNWDYKVLFGEYERWRRYNL